MEKGKKDKIKELEYELGRYRKKVADDAVTMENLRTQIEQSMRGNREINRLVDAILIQAALVCGVDAVDPDNVSVVLGKRLELPMFDVAALLDKYELRARRDEEKCAYVIGVMAKDWGEPEDGQ